MTRRPVLLGLLAAFAAGPASAQNEGPTFERDVRPVLVKRCTVCHSAKKIDDLDVSAGLALDTYGAVMAGVKGRPVVVPGKSAESSLVTRLTDPDDDRRMPLSDKALAENDQKLLTRWVDAGAPRGTPLAAENVPAAAPRKIRPARTLDVAIPTEAKAPGGGTVQVSAKVGPLPSVTALAFRGDGRLLAVGAYGSVTLWDLVDGRPARVLNDLPGPVHALAFSRDGRRLAVGSGLPARSGVVRVYDVPGGTLLSDFEGHGDVVFGLAFRPDGGQLASASFDQTVRLWDLAAGRADGVFRGHSDFVYDVAYDRDGKTLWSASKDRSVKRFDAVKVKELRTYSEHDDDVLALAVPPEGGRFVSAGHEPQLRWWGADGEKSEKRQGGHNGPVHDLAFSADGSRLVSASGDGSVRLWDGRSGAPLKTLLRGGEWQYAAALSADGTRAASGSWDGMVRVWDADSGKLLATLIQPPSDSPGQDGDWLAVAPSGYLAASPALGGLLHCKVNGKDLESRAPLENPERLSRALRGEPTPAPFPK